MCKDIDNTTQSIEKCNTELLEYKKTMRELKWEQFDLIQERISNVTDEVDFLIELMSSDKLHNDDGSLTDEGMATLGLYGQKYNTLMYQADDYANQIKELNDAIAEAPYNQDLINRRQELIELQRESILAAEDEKQAIVDLVQQGIDKELSALDEKIQKYEESIQSAKDLYDYEQKVSQSTKNIASLQKQLESYSGFDDEETKAKVQKLKVEFEEAKADLESTQYDKYISDQSALLDDLALEYENVLNSRLDNVDELITQVIDAINVAAGAEGIITIALGEDGAIAKIVGSGTTTIGETLTKVTGDVGTSLSNTMKDIWLTGDGNVKNILTTYGAGFQDKQTTTNIALGKIEADVRAMVDDVDKEANTKVSSNKTSSSSEKNPTQNNNTSKQNNSNTGGQKRQITNDVLKGIAAAIWIYGKDSGWGNNPFRENKLKDKIGATNAKKVQDIVNAQGSSGGLYSYWLKTGKSNLNQYRYSAFKLGAKNINETQLAWTQEKGQEFIVRPSDGAILTPIAKGDSVLNAQASSNIWDLANSPAEFIKDNLNLGTANNVPNNSTVQNNTVQNFENIVFSMPNVRNYEQLLSEMQKDKNFERLVLSMSVDRLAGKSSLAKGKSIR